MSQEIITRPLSAVSADWSSNREQLELLKRTICKDSTDDEFQLFIHVAKRSGLDPFARQIHAVKRWNEKAKRYDMSIQVGIDGFRLIADRTGLYAGSDDPIFDDEDKPSKATVTVYKIVQGARCAFTATARWNEYYPGDKQGFMWNSKPCLMLSKCAESLALRKAFPAELSGLYTHEEMEQAGSKNPLSEAPQALGNETPQIGASQKSARRDRKQLGDEIRKHASVMNLSKAEVDQWVKDLFNKTSAELTNEEMERFLTTLQEEAGRNGVAV